MLLRNVIKFGLVSLCALPVAASAESMEVNQSSVLISLGSAQVDGVANSSGGSGFSSLELRNGTVYKNAQEVIYAQTYGALKMTSVAVKPAGTTEASFKLFGFVAGGDVSVAAFDAWLNKGELAWSPVLDGFYLGGELGFPLLATEAVLVPSGSSKFNYSMRVSLGYHVSRHLDLAWYSETLANLAFGPGLYNVKQSGADLVWRW